MTTRKKKNEELTKTIEEIMDKFKQKFEAKLQKPLEKLMNELDDYMYPQMVKMLPKLTRLRKFHITWYLVSIAIMIYNLFLEYNTLGIIVSLLWYAMGIYHYVEMRRTHKMYKNAKKFTDKYEKRMLKTTDQHLAEQGYVR